MDFLTKDNITFFIAIIGCFTGIAGLSINLYRLLGERFRLKIIFAHSENWFFDKIENYDTYITNLQAVVRINFVNKSTHPVSIYDVDIHLGKKRLKFEHYNEERLQLLKIYEDEFPRRRMFDSLPMDRQIYFPLRLQPHETYEGFLFFPYFPDTDSNEETLQFVFSTTKRTVKKRCIVKSHFPRKIQDPNEIPW